MKKIGIIGCGAVTEKLYLKTLPNFKNFEIAYLTDRDTARANKLADITKSTVTDVDTLNKNADVIIVCTPPSSHYDLIKQAISPGKIIVSEKPFLAEAQKVIELRNIAKQAGADLYVAHFRRTFPSVILAKQLIKTLYPGKLLSIDISEGGRFNWGAKSDYFVANPLGGVTLDTGSHVIDMALFAAGLDEENVSVTVNSCKKDKSEPSHEVNASLTLTNGNRGIKTNIMLSRYNILANQIVYTFENAKITLPSSFTNYVKIDQGGEKVVVYAPNKFSSLPEAFYAQYRQILNKVNDEHFYAGRFYNLTQVLETINNA